MDRFARRWESVQLIQGNVRVSSQIARRFAPRVKQSDTGQNIIVSI